MEEIQDTRTPTSEPCDIEKKKRQDVDTNDVLAATLIPVRNNLTSLRCGSCGAQFESLYCLTVHLEETGHKPASDVAILPVPSPATSPSSTERKPAVASLAVNATTPSAPAPQRLVRGQDVWLARGVEQTDRILRCIQCNAPARSLAELTLHMVHTKHYINIVGPTTSATSNVAVQPPPTPREKPADNLVLKTKNGLRTGSSKNHGLVNTKMRCSDHVVDDDHSMSQQRPDFLRTSAVGEHNTNRDKDENTNSEQQRRLRVCGDGATGSSDALADGKLRRASFSVRNLIADDVDDDDACAHNDLRFPLTTAPPSDILGRSMTSSVGPEVTSSSDERRSPVTVVAESV